MADVHLGLRVNDPAGREARFVAFLRSIDPARTEALYLLGDIWDFWYEYRDVVPKGYVRVFAALTDLMDAGVKVFFFRGNHDIWTYRYFRELGITILEQPAVVTIGDKRFCLGHGHLLGPVKKGDRLLQGFFNNRVAQVLFSALHPRIGFGLGNGWSRRSRLGKDLGYQFKGEEEPLYKFCATFPEPVDYFIFGHYHTRVDMPVGTARLLMLKDWVTSSNWMVFDRENGLSVVYKDISGTTGTSGSSQKME